jgi:hypothetical protein
MKEYYDARAAEYDEWYHGLGRFDGLDRSHWDDELHELERTIAALPPARTAFNRNRRTRRSRQPDQMRPARAPSRRAARGRAAGAARLRRRPRPLPQTPADHRADLRSDEGESRLRPLLMPRARRLPGRVESDHRHPQPLEGPAARLGGRGLSRSRRRDRRRDRFSSAPERSRGPRCGFTRQPRLRGFVRQRRRPGPRLPLSNENRPAIYRSASKSQGFFFGRRVRARMRASRRLLVVAEDAGRPSGISWQRALTVLAWLQPLGLTHSSCAPPR